MPNRPDTTPTLPIPEWLPDLPDLGNPGSSVIQNVYARTPFSYGPVGGPKPYGAAPLTARCQGACAYMDTLGNVNIFAGDAAKLYQLKAGLANFADVSKAGGYTTGPAGQWNFQYFNDLAIATNRADPIQSFDLASSPLFADLSAAAPRASYAAVIKNFLMVADTFDGVDGDQPQRCWWSAAGDPTNWPTPGSITAAQVQSSFNNLYGDFGFIKGIVGNLGNADGAVFMEKAVFRITYAGPPVVFDFLPAEGIRGCPAQNSIVQYGNLVYYLGEDGFYVYDGLSSTPIGANKIDKTFYGDLDQNYFDRIRGSADPINKQIMWAYPGAQNNGGLCNRVLVYNWQLQRWTLLLIECEAVMRLLSIGYTLDELYTVLGYSLDTLPAPLDSRIWTGGSLLLGIFDGTHKLNYLTGDNLPVVCETSETEFIPGRIVKVGGVKPQVDGGVPSIEIGRRFREMDEVEFASPSAVNSIGVCPHAPVSGNFFRFRLTMPAASEFQNIRGIQVIELAQGGTR